MHLSVCLTAPLFLPDESSSWLPLYGNLCSKLVAQPVCMTSTVMCGYLSQKVLLSAALAFATQTVEFFVFSIYTVYFFVVVLEKRGGHGPLVQAVLCAERWRFILLLHPRRN